MITTKIPFLERVPQETQVAINRWYIFSVITISSIIVSACAISCFSYYMLKSQQKNYKQLSAQSERAENYEVAAKQSHAYALLLVKALEQSMETLPQDAYFTSLIYEPGKIKIEGNASSLKLVSAFIDDLVRSGVYKYVTLARLEQNNKESKKIGLKFQIQLVL